MFIYASNQPRTEFKGDIWAMKANVHYMTHFNNFLILNAMQKDQKHNEAAQIEKELTICKRKMAFWGRHPNYSAAEVSPQKEELVRLWKGRA